MTKRTLYIAAYDISDDARLRRALHVVKNYATGGQKSVYECFLDRAEREELLNDIRDVLDLDEDRFALLRVEQQARGRILGIAVSPADPAYYYVG